MNLGGDAAQSVMRRMPSREHTGNPLAALVGKNNAGLLSDCYATGPVTGSIDYAGGLVGTNDSGTVLRCHATGTVSGGYAGGVAGYSAGTLTQCYATGAIFGGRRIGGLVERQRGRRERFLRGRSNAFGRWYGKGCGGLIGVNEGAVANCYATGPRRRPVRRESAA